MTPEETRILLAEAAAVDNRKQSIEAANAWHKVLARYTLDQCRDAMVIFWRNRPDDYLKPGHLADIIGRRTDVPPACEHGVHVSDTRPCYDCRHGFADQPGPPPNIQSHVLANLDLGKGRWAEQADPADVLALKAKFRAPGVVYPSERTCLDGHDLDHYRPVIGADGRMCAHPDHHPNRADQTEEVDW